jgi:hypothetical protein
MPNRPPQRLKFVSCETESLPEGHERATVTLVLPPDRRFVGSADCQESATGGLRCAAEATLDALSEAMGEAGATLELIGARAVKAFDAEVVIVALSARWEGETRRLVGSYLVDEAPERGAAIAVLNATNRMLGVTMYWG